SGSVTVLLGGATLVRQDSSTSANPGRVAVGDLNGDGAPDVVTKDVFSPTIGVLVGNGDGTFQAPLLLTGVGGDVGGLVVGDFNGDGSEDIADAGNSGGVGPGLGIFLGNGDGTFQARADAFAGGSFLSLTSGDFNGNGVLDLAATELPDIAEVLL